LYAFLISPMHATWPSHIFLLDFVSRKSLTVLNYTPRHEDVLEGGGIAPRILLASHITACFFMVFTFVPNILLST
jgi:hypothetical protein